MSQNQTTVRWVKRVNIHDSIRCLEHLSDTITTLKDSPRFRQDLYAGAAIDACLTLVEERIDRLNTHLKNVANVEMNG